MNQRGAHSVTGRRRHGLGWIPWLAVVLLILTVVVVALIIAAV
jgi:hypothetical protein